MAENSNIEWCDHTFNPWTGCTKLCHPDLPGGSHDAMSELNTARDQAAAQAILP